VFSKLALDRPAEALPPALRLMQRYPDLPRSFIHAATATEMLGRMEESRAYRRLALDRCMRWVEKHPDDGYMRSLLAGELAIAGETEASLLQNSHARVLAPDDQRVQYNGACMLARMGRGDEAMQILATKFGSILGPNSVEWPRHDPDLASLRERPEFQALWHTPGPPSDSAVKTD
jgi:hypothetical protein